MKQRDAPLQTKQRPTHHSTVAVNLHIPVRTGTDRHLPFLNYTTTFFFVFCDKLLVLLLYANYIGLSGV